MGWLYAAAEKEDGVYEWEKLAVLPEYRHGGYSVQLIYFATQQVKTWGGCQMTIGIIEENSRLRDYYIWQGASAILEQKSCRTCRLRLG